jgi:dihydrofolate reductase
MIISLIAAIDQNRLIGDGSKMPWNLPDDLQYYLDTTKDHWVLLGRVTYQAYKKVMKDHRMIVVTSRKELSDDNIHIVSDPQKGIDYARSMGEEELFVSGGSQIYEATLNQADRLYLTRIHGSFEGDRYFPEFEPTNWKEVSRTHHPADARHAWAHDYIVMTRK